MLFITEGIPFEILSNKTQLHVQEIPIFTSDFFLYSPHIEIDNEGEGCSNPVGLIEEPKFRRGRGKPRKVRGSGGRGRPQAQVQKISNPPKAE